MAQRKRAIEILMTGRIDGRFNTMLSKAQRGLGRYRLMLTGVQSSEKGLARQNRALQSTLAGAGGSLFRTALGYAGAYLGAQQLAEGVRSCITGYQDEVTEENRLYQLMKKAGGATNSQVASMKRYAERLMSVTTLTHETTERGMGQLATYRLQASSIRKLTPALQDLIVGTFGLNANEQDAQKAGNMLGKVFTGQVGALRRVGISFDKHQEKMLKQGSQAQKVAMLIRVIDQNYGGLARRMAATPQGRVVQLAQAWGEVKESIGARLYPVISRLLNWVGPRLPTIQRALMRLVTALLRIVPVVSRIAVFVGKHWRAFAPIIAGIVAGILVWRAAIVYLTLAQLALSASMSVTPIGLIIVGIGALIGIVSLLVVNWQKIVGWLRAGWQWFMRLSAVKAVVNAVAVAWGGVVTAVKAVWSWLVRAGTWFAGLVMVRVYVAVLITAWQAMGTAIGVVWGWIGRLAAGIRSGLVAAWSGVLGAVRAVWTWLVKAWQWFARLTIVQNYVRGVKIVWDGLVTGFRTAVSWVSRLWGFIVRIWAKLKSSAIGRLVSGAGAWADRVISGKRAAGGPVAAGRGYLVGERGPELFFPSLSGYVAPNAALAGSGGGGAVVVHFSPTINITGNASRSEVQAGVRAGYDEFKRHLDRYFREERRRSID